MPTAPVSDGRTARSQRTRTAVVDALLALLREGRLRPTAREIAARAGVSLRSVYVHFDDLEDLFVAASDRQFQLVRPMLEETPATGSLAVRAAALMRVRGRIYEAIGPVRRAAELQEPFSPTLSKRGRAIRKAARADLTRVFATELDPLPPDVRTRRVAVLEAITGGAAWDHIRSHPGIDDAAARLAVVEAVLALLEPRA